ncbi:PqiC family protein [Marinobacter salicampi]|uniref:PqiC family protein n=1 Tax=Marinobacter salicampi TaxID=435907 RepID=UPI00140C14DD|nr:PqiC family protein [Marinobacter salicampi]
MINAQARAPSFRALMVFMLLASLGACTSPQVRFHTLVPLAEGEITNSEKIPADVSSLRLESVTVPPQVDRSEVVLRTDDSSLAIMGSDWWGASLSEEIRSALETRFARFKAGNSETPVRVRVEIIRFDLVSNQYALLEARYQVLRQGDGQLTCKVVASAQAGHEINSLVIAQQSNLALLARHAMAASRALTEGGGCPGKAPEPE